MRFLRFLLVLIVVLFVIAGIVAWTCPADFVYRQFASHFGSLRLSGISGTVWQGHAASAELFGQPLGTLDWQMESEPLLMRADVVAKAHLVGNGVTADGVVRRSAEGKISFSDTTVNLPAQMLAPAIDLPSLQLTGQVEIKVEQARLIGIWFDDARGTAHWRGAGVTGAAQATFGEIESTFASTSDGSIQGTVHDNGGPLSVAGTFKIIAGSYEAQAKLATRDGNPQVNEALQYIGQAQADGTSQLLIRGQMFKLF